MRKKILAAAGAALVAGLVLSACGNDDGQQNANPDGVYTGTLTDTASGKTTPVVAIVAGDGVGRVGAADGTYYQLSHVDTSGSGVFADLVLFNDDSKFPASTTSVPGGKVTGSVSGSKVLLNYSIPGATAATTGSIALTPDASYNSPSSLASLVGNWSGTDSATKRTVTVSVTSDGKFNGSDDVGNFYLGQFFVLDGKFNAYQENISIFDVFGNTSNFSLFGLSTYVPASGSGDSAVPASILLLADDNVGNFMNLKLIQQAD